jgi:hypothetical protein
MECLGPHCKFPRPRSNRVPCEPGSCRQNILHHRNEGPPGDHRHRHICSRRVFFQVQPKRFCFWAQQQPTCFFRQSFSCFSWSGRLEAWYGPISKVFTHSPFSAFGPGFWSQNLALSEVGVLSLHLQTSITVKKTNVSATFLFH